jgi:predicted ArsR family transcriptional regulator
MGNANSGRRPDHQRHRLVLRLREQGLTLAEIGHRLGVTRQAVANMLDRLAAEEDLEPRRRQQLAGKQQPQAIP